MNTVCEQCRRAGDKLMLKGDRCLSAKCAMVKHPFAPGSRGSDSRAPKKSEFGRQLLEKQKTRGIYGIREKQFRSYVTRAEKMVGNTAENILTLLELRLDNVIFRLKLAATRAQARQMVSHGLVRVNGRKVTIPSYSVSVGDSIEPKYKEKYTDIKADGVSSWLDLDAKKVTGQVKNVPVREEIDTPINENLIVEFYSR